ncbi:MAG: CvpA family protein, partial [Candidatus Limnocylindrales bacterium]
MDIAGFFATVDLADLVVFAYLLGWFVLGWAQGAVRRLVGILTITFSFFLAAQLNVYLGPFLASHWVQFPAGYSEMLGFGTLFVAGFLAFALIVQGTYSRVAVFAAHPIIDE